MRVMATTPVRRGRPPRPAPNLSELRRVAKRLAAHTELVAKRDRLILAALDAGGAQRVVAAAAGVSRQRVAQLALTRR